MSKSDVRTFETLPGEIKLLIMHHLPDVASLKNLVRASPNSHHVYANTRNETFTDATLNTLASRNLWFDIPTKFVSIRLYGNQISNDFIEDAIIFAYEQTRAKKFVSLSIEQCLAMLCIEDAIRWYVDEEEDEGDESCYECHQSELYTSSWAPYSLIELEASKEEKELDALAAEMEAELEGYIQNGYN